MDATAALMVSSIRVKPCCGDERPCAFALNPNLNLLSEQKDTGWILTLEISSNFLSEYFGGAAAPPYRRWVGRCCRNAQISNIFG
jgi:hypothetical protein